MDHRDSLKKVNIVIPVYNALEKVKECAASIRRCTDFENARVIFVDDKSTDPEVLPFLEKTVGEAGFHGSLLRNERNLGFSASINRGIVEARSWDGTAAMTDVILLNSDTIVTEGWVEKLQRAAYSDPSIATATPLSNNATIFSVPEFCQANVLPEGYSLEKYAEIVEKASLHSYPQVPVAHGFCMYVKRAALDAAGLFDSETFGRGYGEENDFCFRAEQMGFKHILCDDTYVYHNETASFKTEEKEQLIHAHEKILLQRYPEQMKKNAEYIRSDPDRYVRDNIRLRQRLEGKQAADGQKLALKPGILYILHSDFREDAQNNIGGTQFHVKDLMRELRRDFRVFIASRDGAYLRLTLYTGDDRVSFRFYIGEQRKYYSFYDKKLRALFDLILDYFGISLVHVHHCGSLSFDIFDAAVERGIPLAVTLHDFYYVCPNVKLLEKGRRYCAGHSEDCRGCLEDQMNLTVHADYKSYWQKQCRAALEKADLLIVPSESAKAIYGSLIPELAGRIRVIPHGMDPAVSDAGEEAPGKKEKNERKRIAFIGWLNEAKGSQLAYEMIRTADDRYDWFLIGGLADVDLYALEKKNLTKIDRYSQEEAGKILRENRIDLVCILPIWPETFCYTLSEALLAGVPVLTTDIGAVGERMRNCHCGWTVQYQTEPKEILKKIDEIFADTEQYERALESLKDYRHRTIADMAGEYAGIYRELLRKPEQGEKSGELSDEIKRRVYAAYAACPDSGAQTTGDQAELGQRVDELEKRLREITGSVEYKVVNQLSGMNFPLKKQMTGILRAGYQAYRKFSK